MGGEKREGGGDDSLFGNLFGHPSHASCNQCWAGGRSQEIKLLSLAPSTHTHTDTHTTTAPGINESSPPSTLEPSVRRCC